MPTSNASISGRGAASRECPSPKRFALRPSLREVGAGLRSRACLFPAAAEPVAKHHMIAAANPFAAKAGWQMLRARRLGGGCGDRGAAGADPGRAGIVRHRRRRVHDAVRSQDEEDDELRRPRDRAGFGDAHHVPGRERQAARASSRRFRAGFPSACPASSRCSTWRTRNTESFPGRNCSSPPSSSPRKAFRSARSLPRHCSAYPQMARMPDIKRYFYHADGTPYAEGETLKNPELAADAARDREGWRRRRSIPAPSRRPSSTRWSTRRSIPRGMTLADLAHYTRASARRSAAPIAATSSARWARRAPAASRCCRFWECSSAFRRRTLAPDTLEGVHLFTQASRLAFADRAEYLGDPDFVKVPVKRTARPQLSRAALGADRSGQGHGHRAGRHAAGRKRLRAAALARACRAPATCPSSTTTARSCR